MQQKAIPIAMKGKDLLGTAQSGSGKTAAFLLPILNNLAQTRIEVPVLRALIIAPTRELAKQISQAVDDLGKYLDIKNTTIFGGVSLKDQEKKIANGLDIVVATTGRLMEHLRNNTIDLSSITHVVIDEVDTILAMGFLEDLEAILPNVGPNRQIMMFSATLNQNVKKLAKEFLNDPAVVEVVNQRSSVDIIEQRVIEVDPNQKAPLLSYLIGSQNYPQVLVFVNTKKIADALVRHFELDGLPSACIHGDVRQSARAKALRKFKEGEIRVLVATDIAARGIDIEMLPVVVNFELPETIADYTHRIGRTGRAGNPGTAITLLSVKDYRMMMDIEKELILDLGRQTVEDFEPTEKKPRLVKPKPKKLSEKKAGNREKVAKRGPKKSKKTTKRDEGRSFRR
ncbi:DEAD/DEAH box helicase [Malaciobacter pacificus]|uniref:DEAD/DEAH box helicase n=1 Tax=Malaciobacter pacificus TaxID=1080223 RepID=UPI001D17F553|nr:DEAD/DEAH box helicase [Malaciobacter pacificus]